MMWSFIRVALFAGAFTAGWILPFSQTTEYPAPIEEAGASTLEVLCEGGSVVVVPAGPDSSVVTLHCVNSDTLKVVEPETPVPELFEDPQPTRSEHPLWMVLAALGH